jgi:serine/threonine protein kinase
MANRERGYVFNGRWKVHRVLNKGGQGTAYFVRDLETGTDGWVLKELHDDPANRQRRQKRLDRFEREIAALERVNSAHVPPVIRPVDEGELYFVTPYVGKNFHQVSDAVEPIPLVERFRGIVVAVRDAHAKGVVHRDIKPNNVTVNADGTPFLVDFGICAVDEELDGGLTSTMEALGNRNFTAPECEAGSEEECGPPSDVYSLGKVLYWMASGRRNLPQQKFNRDRLTITDPHAHQYISVVIEHTVLDDPGARWTSSTLLERVDWVLAKLREHALIRASGLLVLEDGFGPNDSCNESGQRSTTRAPRGNPPADYELAESFFVGGETATLDRLDIGVRLMHGSGRLTVTLIKGDDEVPSGSAEGVVEQWSTLAGQPSAVQVIQLRSGGSKTLGPHSTYWVKLTAYDEDSDIGWVSAALELMQRPVHFADRNRTDEWTPRVSASGPGLAFRVLARPDSMGDEHAPNVLVE